MNFIRKNIFLLIFILIANIYLILSYIPFIATTSLVKSDSVAHFDFTQVTSVDYNVYLSVIRQGKEGQWFMKDQFTTEPTNPTVFYFFYIVIGKIAAVFSLTPSGAFHLSRIVSVELLFILTFVLAKNILGKIPGFYAALFTVISTLAPLSFMKDANTWSGFPPWWHQVESLSRISIMPHYTASYGLVIGAFINLVNYFEKKSYFSVFMATVLTLLAGMFLPSSVMPIAAGLGASAFLMIFSDLLNQKSPKQNIKISLPLLLPVAASISMLLIHRAQNNNGFPWVTWNAFEMNAYNTNPAFNHDVFFIFGMLLPLSIPGLLYFLLSNNFIRKIIAVWALIPFAGLFFAPLLQVAKYRFICTNAYLPLSILGSYFIFNVKIPRIPRKLFQIISVSFILISSILVSLFIFRRDYENAKRYPYYLNIFVPKTTIKLYENLPNLVPKGSTVLAEWMNANIIPAYADVLVFAGHPVHTMNFETKVLATNRFYRGMSDDEAYNFLKINKINFVIFSRIELAMTSSLKYPFLEKVFSDTDAQLYKVKNIK